MVDFGTRLKELRQKSGLTQKQLADRMWISKAAVSYYEQSLRSPSSEVLVKLAEIFHVTTDYLLGIEDKRQVIDVTDLPNEDIQLLEDAVALLRRKNFDRSKAEERGGERER
ncbi:MAG: helix-turn-helix domain-containing protein [Oscillospiraceae bacterium]|nr:helix-turn-helix domain-containing protein [Oscillospiraceae bacterium]